MAAAFFYILWNRAYVFYAPSEYGNVNPSDFMSAMRDAPVVVDQVELAKSVEENPLDENARFSLIDTMADDAEIQSVIFMYEYEKDLTAFSFYIHAYKHGGMGSGAAPFSTKGRLEGAGIVRRSSSSRWSLTEEGKRFAAWLIERDRKADYFWTEAGGWGTPEPGSQEESGLMMHACAPSSGGNQSRPRPFPRHPQRTCVLAPITNKNSVKTICQTKSGQQTPAS